MFLWRADENYSLIIIKYPPYLFHCLYYTVGIKLSIYIQQNWKVQLQETMYNYNDIHFSVSANRSLITYEPNRANLIWKVKSLKDAPKALLKRPKND